MPGNTAEFSFLLNSSLWPLLRMMPPRGPRSVLCVVEVTTWACGSGLGYSPAATSPATWAMSTQNSAPTLSAIWRMRAQSFTREYAENPPISIFGRVSSAMRSISS